MRPFRIEYDFFDRNQVCKLVVDRTQTAVRVVLVTDGKLFADSFRTAECGGKGTTVTVGSNVFAPLGVRCDMEVDGLRVEILADFEVQCDMKTPFGFAATAGLAQYSLDVPCVMARVGGVLSIGGVRWTAASVAVHFVTGDRTGLPHAVVTGIGSGAALFCALGKNKTMGARWSFCRATLVTPEHIYVLGSPTRLTELSRGARELTCTMRAPAATVELSVRADAAWTDADGTVFFDGARADVTAQGIVTRQEQRRYYLPAMGSLRLGEAVRQPERVGAHAGKQCRTDE